MDAKTKEERTADTCLQCLVEMKLICADEFRSIQDNRNICTKAALKEHYQAEEKKHYSPNEDEELADRLEADEFHASNSEDDDND